MEVRVGPAAVTIHSDTEFAVSDQRNPSTSPRPIPVIAANHIADPSRCLMATWRNWRSWCSFQQRCSGAP